MKARHKSCLDFAVALNLFRCEVQYKTFIINSLNNLNTVQIANHELYIYFFFFGLHFDRSDSAFNQLNGEQ